jgi:nitrogenase molybdenum-cofactor synthesis protein NifE
LGESAGFAANACGSHDGNLIIKGDDPEMKNLFRFLPPFAPDYSGVCSALFELGGLMIIIDASGCTGNYTGYDEPRWYGSPGRVLCSRLREIDAVLGDEAKLFRKAEAYLQTHQTPFIALLGSPAPMIIGMDYRAITTELAQRFTLPALAFDTNGLRHYDQGAAQAYLEMARLFVKPPERKVEEGVNIIGALPLNLGNPANFHLLRKTVEQEGYTVISSWSMDCDPPTVTRAAEATLNLVVSVSGLTAARYLEKEYGIPYLVGMPIGKQAVKRWRELIRRGCSGWLAEGPPSPEKTGPAALVIGEQVTANAIRNCLRDDFGFVRVDVASYFTMDAGFMETGDRRLHAEADLMALTEQGSYEVIVGDPLYQPLTTTGRRGVYIGLPHYAVSSKIFPPGNNLFMADAGYELIAKALGGCKQRKELLAVGC